MYFLWFKAHQIALIYKPGAWEAARSSANSNSRTSSLIELAKAERRTQKKWRSQFEV